MFGVLARQTAPGGSISIRSVFSAGQVRHATKKAGGSTSNGRSSQPKFLGIKTGNGTMVEPGRIILKQRGTEWHEGPGVGRAKDHTLYALQKGRVVFRYDVASQRRYVTVSDCSGVEAPLVGTGSRTETKQRVADAVDAQKYLSLNHLERRDYVLGLAKKLDRESEQEKKEQLAARLMQPKRATFSLVDLTML